MSKRTPVPRRLGRPPDVDSSETRERLLGVARQAFAHNGYDATTNKEIAAAAGITAGAIYHYYPSKVDLYMAVYDETQTLVFNAFEQAVALRDGLIARFSAALDVAVELNRQDPSLAGFVVGVAGEAQRHPDLADRIAPLRAVNGNFLASLVADAHEGGELANDVKLSAVEDLLNAVLSGLARFSNHTGDAERHADAVDALKRFFAGTLVRQ